ncbi:MAG: complex I subunit 1 family protein [Candidatus Hadarchaeia archaeon]
MEIISFLISYLVFPGLIFSVVFGLLYEGIDRKIAAHMQNRIGPPLWQPFLDIGKLLSKEDIIPAKAQKLFFSSAPLLAFGAIITVMLFIPVHSIEAALGSSADLIVVIYLLNIPAISLMIGGYSSSSPFGAIGSARYAVQLFSYEFAFIIAALTVSGHLINVGWSNPLSITSIVEYQVENSWLIYKLPLACVAMLLVAPGKLLKTPFDIPEAETEIVSGPLTEYAGPKLAVFKTTFNVEILALSALLSALFLGGPQSITVQGFSIPGIVSFFIKTIAILILVTLIRCITARLKIHQTLKFYWIPVATLAILNLVWVVI